MNAYNRDMGQPDAVRRVTISAEFEYCQPLISTSEQRGNASLIGATPFFSFCARIFATGGELGVT
jgi:hypothetical protein